MSALDTTTGELVEPMSADAARRLTERIRIAAANFAEAKAKVLALVDEAKAGQAHVSLGYASWTAYLSDVLSDEPLRLARDERRELVTRLADEGMSTRAIAPIVGASQRTVADDIRSGEQSCSPTEPVPVTGLDGKTYPTPEPRKPRGVSDARKLHGVLDALRPIVVYTLPGLTDLDTSVTAWHVLALTGAQS